MYKLSYIYHHIIKPKKCAFLRLKCDHCVVLNIISGNLIIFCTLKS